MRRALHLRVCGNRQFFTQVLNLQVGYIISYIYIYISPYRCYIYIYRERELHTNTHTYKERERESYYSVRGKRRLYS